MSSQLKYFHVQEEDSRAWCLCQRMRAVLQNMTNVTASRDRRHQLSFLDELMKPLTWQELFWLSLLLVWSSLFLSACALWLLLEHSWQQQGYRLYFIYVYFSRLAVIQLGDFFPVKILAHLHTLYYRDFYRCWLAATVPPPSRGHGEPGAQRPLIGR
jgi:hypothetical protein